MDVKNKVALITGGTGGIGLAIARALLKNGAKGVTIVDLNDVTGQEASGKLNKEFGNGKCIFVKADVTNSDELEDAFKKTVATFNQLDIVHNNAAIMFEHSWVKMNNVNLTGATHCLLLAIENYVQKYKSTAEGVIINTASIAGVDPTPIAPHYGATKAALIALTLSFGSEFHFKRTGVKVKAICPGLTDTSMLEGLDQKLQYFDSSIKDEYVNQTAEEVAERVLEILQECDGNGTLWVIEAGKKRKIEYPKLL